MQPSEAPRQMTSLEIANQRKEIELIGAVRGTCMQMLFFRDEISKEVRIKLIEEMDRTVQKMMEGL